MSLFIPEDRARVDEQLNGGLRLIAAIDVQKNQALDALDVSSLSHFREATQNTLINAGRMYVLMGKLVDQADAHASIERADASERFRALDFLHTARLMRSLSEDVSRCVRGLCSAASTLSELLTDEILRVQTEIENALRETYEDLRKYELVPECGQSGEAVPAEVVREGMNKLRVDATIPEFIKVGIFTRLSERSESVEFTGERLKLLFAFQESISKVFDSALTLSSVFGDAVLRGVLHIRE